MFLIYWIDKTEFSSAVSFSSKQTFIKAADNDDWLPRIKQFNEELEQKRKNYEEAENDG